MNYKFTIGRRARADENIYNNYQVIDLDTYKIDKPIVLVFGGNGTTDNRAANGNAKVVSSMLGVFNEDVDVLSVNYNQALGEPNITNNCKELVNKLLIPLVSQNGMRIDINTACKNMRSITVFAHCRGVDGPMKRIVSLLCDELFCMGYDEVECAQIISQIVVVAYGVNINNTLPGVKGIYCLSFADDMYPKGAMHLSNQFLNKLDIINMVSTDRELFNNIDTNTPLNSIWKQLTEFLSLHRRVYNINENNNIRLFAYGLLQTDNHLWGVDHSIHGLARDEHYNRHEDASSTGDCVSRCLACALCNSVASSMINQKYTQFVDFDMNKLQKQIDDICKHHNYEQTKLDGVDLEQFNF